MTRLCLYFESKIVSIEPSVTEFIHSLTYRIFPVVVLVVVKAATVMGGEGLTPKINSSDFMGSFTLWYFVALFHPYISYQRQ